ncbi:NAD(P)-binding protein [Cryphonectria parasitica EP155]|uniref:Mannitol 2-dehydrogenase n=1 Tax=Cryphonectria parasitica (strain ATCC 38755 / EP155) TaxID=660469 RepID=A0A9P4Y324_CRYP1|nr:NAD(P)-binding protein [Cryphonectria parasitica EP155]KAF3765535.1 NAD(P)-binding protein [Cryphonectria parasitica EP155]
MASMAQTATRAVRDGISRATSSAIRLNNQNLATIRQQGASHNTKPSAVPGYDRKNLKEGIVHIGVGGFHRAHLAAYVDGLMNKGGARDWAICGVGLQPFDAAMRDALVPQDCLYTLIERAAKGSSASVLGSITSFLYAPDDPTAVINKMADRDTRIVSMTITESGYYYNENTHQLLVEHPDIAEDLKGDLTRPKTTFGYLYASLAQRYESGLLPFTVLSCDNMQKNGTITGNMLKTFARHRSPKVAEWIGEHGAFPNSMVDRITPRTLDNDKASLAETFGIQDSWPVVTEPFNQWVVEDHFAQGRPHFEDVGVQVVKDVEDVERFECHKLRLLNASHTAMSYMAFLGGFQYVHEVIEHPLFSKFIYNMMHQEVRPLLPEIPGVDLDAYCDKLIERFSNPTIMDQITRLTLNGSGKLPQFIMPSIAEQIMNKTHNLKRLSLVVASWFRYLHGVDEHGKPYAIDDPRADELKAKALEGGDRVYPLMAVRDLFGDDLREDKIFMDELQNALESLHREGAMATLAKYVD